MGDTRSPLQDLLHWIPPQYTFFLIRIIWALEPIENEGNKTRPVKKISLVERSEFEIFRALAYFIRPVSLGGWGGPRRGKGPR